MKQLELMIAVELLGREKVVGELEARERPATVVAIGLVVSTLHAGVQGVDQAVSTEATVIASAEKDLVQPGVGLEVFVAHLTFSTAGCCCWLSIGCFVGRSGGLLTFLRFEQSNVGH